MLSCHLAAAGIVLSLPIQKKIVSYVVKFAVYLEGLLQMMRPCCMAVLINTPWLSQHQQQQLQFTIAFLPVMSAAAGIGHTLR
jgi:hypothetical protein